MLLKQQLSETYRSIHDERQYPEWAFKIVPSIPFVDPDAFVPGSGILMYGSAESLASYPAHSRWPEWLKSDIARDRHAHWFNRWLRKDPEARGGDPFPYFHIEPFSQGGLVIAAAFIATLAGRTVDSNRGEFMRTIAVANFGKFAIDAPTNEDYAGSAMHLEPSLPYVAADLDILRPGIVFLPHSTHRHFRRRAGAQVPASTRFVPAMQCQGFNFRRVEANFKERGPALAREYADAAWAKWIPDLGGRLRSAIWCYLAEVEAGWKEGSGRA